MVVLFCHEACMSVLAVFMKGASAGLVHNIVIGIFLIKEITKLNHKQFY